MLAGGRCKAETLCKAPSFIGQKCDDGEKKN